MTIAAGATVRRSVAILLFFVPLTLLAQSGMWGSRGISRRFVVSGNLIIDADGRGLSIYDVHDIANIQRTSVSLLDDESLDAAPMGDHAIALLTRAGIARYSFTDAGASTLETGFPITGLTMLAGDGHLLAGAGNNSVTVWQPASNSLDQIAFIPIMGTIDAIAFHGGDLYVAIDGSGVFVYDPNAPSSPIALMAENAKGLAFSGETLFLASGVDGLTAIDVSNPSSPRVLSRTGAGSVNLFAVVAAGARVYAGQSPATVYVYDASDPTAPKLTDTLNEPVEVLAADGTRMFVSGEIVDRFGIANPTGAPLRVYDFAGATPATGQFTDLAGPVSGAATDGTLAYIADPPFFRVIDVSTTSAPREIASLRIDGIQDFVKIQGSHAMIYGRGDVDIVDISDPYHPKLASTFVSFGRPPSIAAFTTSMLVEGNPWSGFHVVDYTHYVPPAIVGSEKGHYFGVATLGTIAYVLENDQIRLIDMSSLHADLPVIRYIGVAGIQAEIAGATATHPDLLLVHTGNAMIIYGLADPANPALLSVSPLPGSGVFATTPDLAFFADDGIITTIDLRDPSHPVFSPTGMRVTAPMQIAAAGGKIVVADRYSLRVFGPNTAPPPPPPPPPAERRRRARH